MSNNIMCVEVCIMQCKQFFAFACVQACVDAYMSGISTCLLCIIKILTAVFLQSPCIVKS